MTTFQSTLGIRVQAPDQREDEGYVREGQRDGRLDAREHGCKHVGVGHVFGFEVRGDDLAADAHDPVPWGGVSLDLLVVWGEKTYTDARLNQAMTTILLFIGTLSRHIIYGMGSSSTKASTTMLMMPIHR